MAGRLGAVLGLPIPSFKILNIPESLLQFSTVPDIQDLGSGPVFGSQVVEDAQEVAFADLSRIDVPLQQRVLLFDWWVRNEDRTLTEYGGNPNLLWATEEEGVKVFDLNLAFDDTFDEARFWRSHVFNRSVTAWSDDFRTEMIAQMELGLAMLPAIWAELPATWLYPDGDATDAAYLNHGEINNLLARFQQNPRDFWGIRR